MDSQFRRAQTKHITTDAQLIALTCNVYVRVGCTEEGFYFLGKDLNAFALRALSHCHAATP